jgi:4-hydroxythreonine-4-phosphate dehydrogenase
MIKDTCGIKIEGPLPADEAVYQASNGKYDCVIGMYHDQALIPLKMSDRHSGVNITLGLPFVRTSPLHGTAFDIAVNPQTADPRSMIEAVRVAIKCTKNLKNI